MSVLCTTAPVYLAATGKPVQGTAPAGSFWSRIFGGNPPGYQGPPASEASSPATSLASTTSPPTSTTPPPAAPPPLREVIVVVPDSLFQSFTDQLRTVGLAVERPHG